MKLIKVGVETMVVKFILLLLISFSFTQEVCEGTCFSEEEVQNMFSNIKALEFKREVYRLALNELKDNFCIEMNND